MHILVQCKSVLLDVFIIFIKLVAPHHLSTLPYLNIGVVGPLPDSAVKEKMTANQMSQKLRCLS